VVWIEGDDTTLAVFELKGALFLGSNCFFAAIVTLPENNREQFPTVYSPL
jgi:hypothetical protein